jgi:hypothetical protein
MPATFGRSLVLLLVTAGGVTPAAAGQLVSDVPVTDTSPDLSKLPAPGPIMIGAVT